MCWNLRSLTPGSKHLILENFNENIIEKWVVRYGVSRLSPLSSQLMCWDIVHT